jgi:hypothetical protein
LEKDRSPVIPIFSLYPIISLMNMEVGDDLDLQFGTMGLQNAEDQEMLNQLDSNSQDFGNEQNSIGSACNLIINYLPHDIDDNALRVSSNILGIFIFYFHQFIICHFSLGFISRIW